MKYPKLHTYAQLLRLPNVFTAFADICMAAAATGLLVDRPGTFALVLLASGCLYLGGMVSNDFFDRAEDARLRPFRPIPSGRVSPRRALAVAVALLAAGFVLALIASEGMFVAGGWPTPALVAAGLIVAIVLYNRWLKHTPIGPIGMGLCRFLNVLLGVSAAGVGAVSDELAFHLAGVVGLYIVGVTWFARTEEAESNRLQLRLAAGVMALAAFAALMVPGHFGEGKAPTPMYFSYLVVAFGFVVGVPLVRAIRQPSPKLVQAAVKQSIFGLVLLDAALAVAFVGWPGLTIILLLLPATWLGKWVYST
ncbi:UbiA family prenyltransferase [Fimbriiglobus ruber]|uniref:Prenyltransferase n=1 Tax=Fimbriiglobus ruber TaxID=1908690 RepID=A0A225DP10_9BACT|nr:UbiA family prenyltransferase [Fimbriiglobus ruber]OWK40318.1 hypothetical protein FRUB_05237 [Fimbriiglobus ruber]